MVTEIEVLKELKAIGFSDIRVASWNKNKVTLRDSKICHLTLSLRLVK